MITSIIRKRHSTVVCFAVAILGWACSAKSEQNSTGIFQVLTVPFGCDISRVNALGKGINFQSWPRTDTLRVSPGIDKAMLINNKLVSKDTTSYDIVQFDEEFWGRRVWSAVYLVENPSVSSIELPTERREKLLRALSPELRANPDYVEKYLQGKLDRYRKSLAHRIEGAIKVEICLAPNAKAACEYLLYHMAQNTMPTNLLVKIYGSADHAPEIGTVNYVTNPGHIKFIRDNVVVIIDGRGEFSRESLQLARKIDMAIKQQSLLTYQQLLSRRPVLTIASEIVEEKTNGLTTISCTATQRHNKKIVSLRASKVKGQYEEVKNGKLVLRKSDKPVKITLIAITDELLVSTVEHKYQSR